MILLDKVVQIFGLAQLDGHTLPPTPAVRISAIPGSAFSLIPGSVSRRCRAAFQCDPGHTLALM